MDERWKVNDKFVQVRCFLCGSWMDVMATKKGKPYTLCLSCGIQTFWRLPLGIERLAEAARDPRVTDVRFVRR